MKNELNWLNALVPDLVQSLRQRYRVLQQIAWLQPVGRRTLSGELEMSERVLRRETDLFREQGLLDSSKSGMILTAEGKELVAHLDVIMSKLNDTFVLGEQLAHHLGIQRVIIIPGDSGSHTQVLKSMGEELNRVLDKLLPLGSSTIAAMGGTTMAAVATALTPQLSKQRQLLFVPARGGLGETMGIQANTICAEMAAHSSGNYRNLYVPEDISPESFQSLVGEPVVRSVLEQISRANVVIHSIGRAKVMAQRRNMTTSEIQLLEERQAVSEAFGVFLDVHGQVVYKVPKIGLQVSDLDKVSDVIAIAGGAQKAQAIQSYMKIAPHQTILITDEAASEMILRDKPLK
ncbi:SorC family transcriptional regulator [Lactobacillus sp. DCY120]|uniref:SorC family transcriptional regulator n=1 Tax=Bombilactobacillus apium TaxID=2675299 RepID=A0A850R518_9LACO|nr:sugar-binding domain-containing protein [Bombilactobacillus apium]NVY97061.1 SorC family transcriptional regulator [Bombilactobacillus apium]